MADSDLIQQFCELTGSNASQASQLLDAHSWNLESAVTDYFQNQEEDVQTAAASSSAAPVEPEYTGPRTLDGRPAPDAARSSASAGKKPKRRTGLATLGSLGGGRNDDDDDDDDDDYEDEEEEKSRGDLFAGGEKSGLAVQDPHAQGASNHKKILKDLLSKAKENADRPEEAASSSSEPQRFRGSGVTLGGDGVESRVIPDPRGPAPSRAERIREAEPQEFVLHIWTDGFSIDDGELRRFDDPANRADLEMIRNGRAPLHLMNVQMGQPVDVKLEQHQEKWHQLPKKYKPFGGSGHRLGSPVPGDGSAAAGLSTTTASAAAAAPPTSAPMSQTDFAVDPNQPAVNVRIQLPDGSRLPGRFNTTHTIGDIYEFLRRASSSLSARPWVLATTFPNKDHTDHSLKLGEMAEFKKGGTAVVKWA